MIDRTNDIATLITQLRVLGQLTRAEAQLARLRVAQASSDAVRAELRQCAADADGRVARIDGALRDLGALTDPVTPLIGRVAALVKGALEQAQPLDEAVLGDLTLEHQLRDRARYVAALADGTGHAEVRALAEHLVAAHTETVQWLTGVLTDLGTGKPAALRASPLQRVAAQVAHVANAPARPALDTVQAGVTRTVQTATKVTEAARDTATAAVDKATAATSEAASGIAQGAATAAGAVRGTAAMAVDTVTEATGTALAGAASGAAVAADVVRQTTAQTLDRAAVAAHEASTAVSDTVERTEEAAGTTATAADAAQRTTEPSADTTTAAADTARSTTDAAEPADAAADTAPGDTGAPDGTDGEAGAPAAATSPVTPPIEGFTDLPAHAAVAALRALDDPRDVTALLELERAHANRPAVVAAARLRAAALGTG